MHDVLAMIGDILLGLLIFAAWACPLFLAIAAIDALTNGRAKDSAKLRRRLLLGLRGGGMGLLCGLGLGIVLCFCEFPYAYADPGGAILYGIFTGLLPGGLLGLIGFGVGWFVISKRKVV